MLLDAGPQIIDRLKSFCLIYPDNTFSTADLATVSETSQVSPARHVVLHSYQPVDTAGSHTLWKEIWLVVIVVKNVRQGVGAEAIRNDAGPMLQETLTALDGFRADGMVGTVASLPPPNPMITAGFGYFPLAFEVKTSQRGVEPEVF